MNLITLSSYFVNIKIPLKNGHVNRTGLIVAYDERKSNPQTKDLLILAYITAQEENDWKKISENGPWEADFLIEGAGNTKYCEVRGWEAAREGYFVLLAEEDIISDEARTYKAFTHLKAGEKSSPLTRGAVLWTEPNSSEIRSNMDQQDKNNLLSYRFEKQEEDDNDADIPLAAAGEQRRQNRQEKDDMCESLIGAMIFQDDGSLAGCCCAANPETESIQMEQVRLDFDIASALQKCGKSRICKAVARGLINPETLKKTCREIREHFSKTINSRDLHRIRGDFGKQMDSIVFPYFNRISLERFLLHTRSCLRNLVKSSIRLRQWNSMLGSLHQAGKTSLARLVLLGLLSSASNQSHAHELASLYSPPSNVLLDDFPLYYHDRRNFDQDTIHLIQFIRSVQEEKLSFENDWHNSFMQIELKNDHFGLKLRGLLNAKNKHALGNLIDEHYPDEEEQCRRRHIDLALAFQELAIPEDIRTGLDLTPEWNELLKNIEEDLFCII